MTAVAARVRLSASMKQAKRAIAVLGDGGWGTALALYLAGRGFSVCLWGAFPQYVRELNTKRVNRKFLPGVAIPKSIRITADLSAALHGSTVAVLAVPAQYMRSVLRHVKKNATNQLTFLSVAKGLENGTLLRMSQVVQQELGSVPVAALSGPNIAREFALQFPASAVVASQQPSVALALQRLLISDRFRVYTSADLAGVEFGGAFKNPLAIATGISDGLGFGSNAKAALITRGVVEMARFGVALGAERHTFWGLSGLGDLITTAISGRNHWLGQQIGKGNRLSAILASTPMVVEGVETCRAAVALARKRRVELPIMEQVHAVLFAKRSPRRAIQSLMMRSGKSEA